VIVAVVGSLRLSVTINSFLSYLIPDVIVLTGDVGRPNYTYG